MGFANGIRRLDPPIGSNEGLLWPWPKSRVGEPVVKAARTGRAGHWFGILTPTLLSLLRHPIIAAFSWQLWPSQLQFIHIKDLLIASIDLRLDGLPLLSRYAKQVNSQPTS